MWKRAGVHGSSKQRMLFNTLIHAARTSVIIPLASSSHQETAKRSADVARLNTHVSRSRPCPRQSFDGRMREKNGGNIVCRYSIEGLPEKRAPLHTSNPCDDVAGLWLRSIYRWKTYVIAMHALCMPRLILFASIQVDDQSAARSPLRTLLRFFRVRVDRMWGSLWRKID